MIFDQQKAFIGSFNFDSRSLLWNTEVGVLVDDPELAGRVRELALEGWHRLSVITPGWKRISWYGSPKTMASNIH